MNAPKLIKFYIDEYTKWFDNIVRSDLPEQSMNQYCKFVKAYQIHHHSKTCRKYTNEKCRFHFGNFFISRFIIAQPLEDCIPDDVKREKMQHTNTILKKVRNYIDNKLNPSKKNFLDKTEDNYVELKSIEEILSLLEISSKDHEEALSISGDTDFQLINNFCD